MKYKIICILGLMLAVTPGVAATVATEGFVRSGLSQKVDKSALAGAIAAAIPAETDPTVPAWAKSTQKPAYTWGEITDKPTFPDDANMVHKTGDESIVGTKTFSSIQISGGTVTGVLNVPTPALP